MVANDWRSFLMQAELVRNYQGVARAVSTSGLTAPNPLLESLLPSLLYIRLGAVIDDALDEHITVQGWTITKPLREDFNGRICFLAAKGLLVRPDDLHNLRLKRNTLAHQPTTKCSWGDLERAIQIGQEELENARLVGPRPKFEFFSTRLPRELHQGEVMGMDYEYGLKEGADIALRMQWGVSIGTTGEKPSD